MQLESIAVNVRTRTAWEAIDLGFAMVRTWWSSIYTPLVILLLGIIASLWLVMPSQYYWVSLLILWWLKPLYHRLILHIISHRMFGEHLSWSTALKQLPELMRHTGLVSELTWRRFSLSRGFKLPIWQLERLRGNARTQRQRLLLGYVHTATIWLNIAMFCFQIILLLSFFALIWLFVPEYYATDFFYQLLSNQLVGIGDYFKIISITGFVLVVAFMEPYYIAASFALYINRRSQLEAWDIELDFRQMAERLEKKQSSPPLNTLLVLAMSTVLISTLLTQPTVADETTIERPIIVEQLAPQRLPATESSRIIKEVMQHDNLRQETNVKRWRFFTPPDAPNQERPAWLRTLADLIASVVSMGLWVLLAIALIALYVTRKSWLPFLVRTSDEVETFKPDILFGMDIREESLPENIVAEANALWQQGKAREALSLLYRCALARLVNQESLALEPSHTEGDILQLSQGVLSTVRQHYLAQLTQHWTQIAYAHQTPSDEAMMQLLNRWEADFIGHTPPQEQAP